MSAFWHFCDMPARADEDRYQSENWSFQGCSHQPIDLICMRLYGDCLALKFGYSLRSVCRVG